MKLNIYLLYTFYWSGIETINLSKPDDHIQTDSKDYLLNSMEEDDTLSKRTGKECLKRIVDAKSDNIFY